MTLTWEISDEPLTGTRVPAITARPCNTHGAATAPAPLYG
jgi:hypothetical protein